MKVIMSYKARHAGHSVKITNTFVARIKKCIEDNKHIMVRRKLAALFHCDKLSTEFTTLTNKENLTLDDAFRVIKLTDKLRHNIKCHYGKKALAFAEQFL